MTTEPIPGTIPVRSVRYYTGDRYLGTGSCRSYLYRGQLWPPVSLAYICPECGQRWGRAEVLQFSGWRARLRKCPLHGPGFLMPPNVFEEYFNFPMNLLIHEILAMRKIPDPRVYHSLLITGD